MPSDPYEISEEASHVYIPALLLLTQKKTNVRKGRCKDSQLSWPTPGCVYKLKNRKKAEEPGMSDPKEPEKGKNMWETMQPKLANPHTQIAIYMTTGLLFLAAVMLVILYMVKLRAVTEKFRAATRIHLFMQQFNASYKGMKPMKTFKGVEESLGQLKERYERNDLVQKATDETIMKIQEGWVPHDGHLYKFINSRESYEEAKIRCFRQNTEMPEVHSKEDQEFLLDLASQHKLSIWLGMKRERKHSKWYWASGREVDNFHYLSPQAIDLGQEPHCMDLSGGCLSHFKPKCWYYVECHRRRNYVCRMKPDPRWLK